MPNLQVEQAKVFPSPATITPALLKQHSITPEEYTRIEAALGRTPSLTEVGIFSVMWSEHCSYKSSRVHLKRLPTRGERTTGPGSVVQGPGENAGIIDVGDGWACAFKIESHNHPSYIEPYQGAATGVGGILRDIFTMNARPLAVMDSLRFGPLDDAEPDEALRRRNHQITTGIVHGVAGYGNCFGVPNLGGETRFEACYSGNPLLNAFALGLVRSDEIFYAKATGVGNPVIYVGAKTGRDGIHGATMASEEFTEGSEQKRPNVQMGDPFMEKLLLEACLEAMATGAVLGIQDMGAAGLTCSTCEMGARGDLGLTVELDLVPQRETGMSSYEIMLSESQERMLLVADKPRAQEVLDVFAKWGLDASIVGTVTEKPNMVITQHGELVADIPNKSLTDDAPLYHRPVGVWKAPVPLDPPAWVLEELKKPRDYTADLKKLLASANICDKRWVFEQYDSMVQTNTVQGPGGEAGVMRIKGTSKSSGAARHDGMLGALADLVATSTPEGAATHATDNHDAANPVVAPDASHEFSDTVKGDRGLAMALAGNGRWTYLDPKLGAMHAVAEAARKVACTGATPVAATNCLNFGNPEKPEIMAQLSQAIDGIAEACTALGTPVTGGNVSLYNETRGEGIYPTPVIGIVGIIDDVTKAVPSSFQHENDVIAVFSPYCAEWDENKDAYTYESSFGSSAFAQVVLGQMWGVPPGIALPHDRRANDAVCELSQKGLLSSASDISDGGFAVALVKACFKKQICARITEVHFASSNTTSLFSESACTFLLSFPQSSLDSIQELLKERGFGGLNVVGRTGGTLIEINNQGDTLVAASIAELSGPWASSLESQLASEAVTA
jgi:phosphoribosylformylglycinamidine synthase